MTADELALLFLQKLHKERIIVFSVAIRGKITRTQQISRAISLLLCACGKLHAICILFHRQNTMSDPILTNWERKSAERQKAYKQFLAKANKNRVLQQLDDLHEQAFEQIDCLSCGNCCKGYSPRFKQPDIKRIAKHLGMKEGELVSTYLKLDEEGDYVMQKTPCAFLGSDNYCSIYEVRPSDCARFPYTNEDVIVKRPNITLKNSTFCPAVYFVLEKLIVSGK